MNTNQITNLVTSILQPLLALLCMRGYLTQNDSETIAGPLGMLIVLVISHLMHSDSPGTSSPPKTGPLMLLAFIMAASLCFTGCTFQREMVTQTVSNGSTNTTRIIRSRLWEGYVIEHSSTMFGADVESPSGQNDGTVKLKVGFGNDYTRFTPTGTNQLWAPEYMSSLHITQGLTSTGISGESGSGHVSIGGTNWSAAATVPGTPANQHP